MNGSAAAAALQLVPTETPERALPGELEYAIGTATAFAVGALSAGLVEYWEDGRLSPEGKSLGGEAVAQLYELQQAAPHLDFASVARVQGMKILRAQYAAGQDHTREFPEMLVTETISELLAIVDRVSQFHATDGELRAARAAARKFL
jgi:hypothetical protein